MVSAIPTTVVVAGPVCEAWDTVPPRRTARPPIDFLRRHSAIRSTYRMFEDAEYRFYRSNSAPPQEGDTPFATNATLPHTPAETYADGTWYLSVSYFNGVIDSGFLPIGAHGETYLRLDIASGAEADAPPLAPQIVRIEDRGGGVVRIVAIYLQAGTNRAEEWAIAYTTDGGTPAADDPDVTVSCTGSGAVVLVYDLPAVADATTVKVRVQTRRNDGTVETPAWSYSEASTVLSLTVETSGPDAAEAGEVT